jgi:hypothetical protein
MASDNFTTLAHRFAVERIDGSFVIFDSQTWTYTACSPGISRVDAEKQCAVLNKPVNEKRSTERTTLYREFHAKGVTPERLSEWVDSYHHQDDDAVHRTPSAPTNARHQRVEEYRSWLPLLLRRWADAVAKRAGYDGPRRKLWFSFIVLKAIDAGELEFTHGDADLDEVQFALLPIHYPYVHDGDSDGVLELRRVLAVHYLSPDSDILKGGHLGMSRRTYQRQAEAAHLWLAARMART